MPLAPPDAPRFLRLARHLLAGGCDALNRRGTIGEATSLSLAQRVAPMTAAAQGGLPTARLMMGTGAAAAPGLPLHLYNFPALSGVAYTPSLVPGIKAVLAQVKADPAFARTCPPLEAAEGATSAWLAQAHAGLSAAGLVLEAAVAQS